MLFRIADSFTKALGRLTAQEQSAAKITVFDLQQDPGAPGLKFHRIDKSKDKNFWSIRVGRDIRVVVHKTADSVNGLIAVFAFTGVMGASIGPMLNYYLAMPGGPAVVMQAMGGTALVFFGLSAYALTTRKDFSYMGGFLFVGLLVAVVASIANIFLGIPALSLTISAAIVMIMSGLILFDTSRIINGGVRSNI